jgi:hypothetical protein
MISEGFSPAAFPRVTIVTGSYGSGHDRALRFVAQKP